MEDGRKDAARRRGWIGTACLLACGVGLVAVGWFLATYLSSRAISQEVGRTHERGKFADFPVPKDLAPPAIFGVPGVEMSIYFDNIGFVEDPDQIRGAVKFTGSFGRLERRRWVGTPTEADVGEHTLSIEVVLYDKDNPDWYEKGEIRVYEIPVVVQPIVEGERKLRVLMVGDSITRQMLWPNALVRHLREKSGIQVSTIGQVEWESSPRLRWFRDPTEKKGEEPEYTEGFHSEWVDFRDASEPGVRAEAYNGWTTASYLQRNFEYHPTVNPESDVSRSPFWWPEALADPKASADGILSYNSDSEGNPIEPGELSFKRYLDVHGDGIPPDVVIMMLGTNDAYFLDPRSGEEQVRASASAYVDRVGELIDLFREVNPRLPILVVSPPPVAVSAVAYHANYGSYSLTASRNAKLSIQIFHEALLRELTGKEAEGIYFVPAFLGMDPVDGYFATQTVHPSPLGHRQLADQVYASVIHWLGDVGSTDPVPNGAGPDAEDVR